MSPSTSAHPFDALTPDLILSATESIGLLTDGRMLALNSYENRVYQVGIEDQVPVIAKFYRPGRWSREQILEEHAFVQELQDAEPLSVVAPLADESGATLHRYADFDFTIYPRRGGHAPELNAATLFTLGTCMGKLHSIGAARAFRYRNTLSIESHGSASREYLLQNGFIPPDLVPAYDSLTGHLMEKVERVFAHCEFDPVRLHGDCHPGNILWRDEVAHFVDFDDCMTGPAMQDLWMLLSGSRDTRIQQLSELVEGYETYFEFQPAQLSLVEALRTLRIMHYSAWLARRWDDPAFPRSFPWFNTVQYWSSHVLELREQMAALDEPPLILN